MNGLQLPDDASAVGSTTFRATIQLLCGIVLLVALTDLVGWCFHVPALVDVLQQTVTMKPNTAVSVLFLAVALWQKQRARRFAFLEAVLLWSVLVLAILTLGEYQTGRDFHVDQVFAHVSPDQAGDPVGRMAIGTAIDTALSATALLVLDIAPAFGSFLAACAGLIAMSALIGTLFDAGPLLGVRLLRSMSVRTAGSFFALQIAYFLLRPQREPTRSLVRSTRHHRGGLWFVVGTSTLPVLLGWPIAILYRTHRLEAEFSFALLIVLLIGAQMLLLAQNSRSMAAVEDKRDLVERDRQLLAMENDRQYAGLVASEARAAESESQYRLITDALPALVSYINRDLRYVRVNHTYLEWFGVSSAAVEGQPIEDILGSSAENIRTHLLTALSGEPQQFESQLQTLQGPRTVSISHIPDLDANGVVRGVIVQANDITARKKTEAALRQTEKLAAVGKLASSIAHEINNPLEAVTNLIYLARATCESRESQLYLDTAEQELMRASAIASQTLRFHRQATRPVSVYVHDLFGSVLTMYQGRLMNSRIAIHHRHRAADPLTCLDGEIRQVLNNLIGNAIDAMLGTGGHLAVRSRQSRHARTRQAGVVLTVADTGYGMNPTTLNNLFEAFYTTKGINGTGLGLWVSKEIIDRHEGILRVRSSQQAGHSGTVFRLFLPYATLSSSSALQN